jgi:hypothetical protein
VSCRVVSCRVVSCRVVSCRVVSCRVVSCRVVCCGGAFREHARVGKLDQIASLASESVKLARTVKDVEVPCC